MTVKKLACVCRNDEWNVVGEYPNRTLHCVSCGHVIYILIHKQEETTERFLDWRRIR